MSSKLSKRFTDFYPTIMNDTKEPFFFIGTPCRIDSYSMVLEAGGSASVKVSDACDTFQLKVFNLAKEAKCFIVGKGNVRLYRSSDGQLMADDNLTGGGNLYGTCSPVGSELGSSGNKGTLALISLLGLIILGLLIFFWRQRKY